MGNKYNRIKVVLAEKDVSQKELAEKIGVSANAISAMCKNKSQPSIKTLYQIADVLEVDVCDLLDRTGNGELPK